MKRSQCRPFNGPDSHIKSLQQDSSQDVRQMINPSGLFGRSEHTHRPTGDLGSEGPKM